MLIGLTAGAVSRSLVQDIPLKLTVTSSFQCLAPSPHTFQSNFTLLGDNLIYGLEAVLLNNLRTLNI